MQTNFSEAQLADSETRESEKIIRTCVHCGFCTATCPTYVLLGDELDSPRGRIYLIKEMLEQGKPATAATALHLDRCLSCLACMTTCPSGVHYQHLIDHARAHVEATYRRPFADRAFRAWLAWLLPHAGRFRLALALAGVARPFRGLTRGRVRAMLDLVPTDLPSPSPIDVPQIFPAIGPRRKRVLLLPGCAQRVVAPSINDATIRLLTRHGCEIVLPRGTGCCGAIVHHLGKVDPADALARDWIDIAMQEIEGEGIDAIVVNASGCGTELKDYGFHFRDDPDYAESAARVAALTRDVTELLEELGLHPPSIGTGLTVAYHSACSMQHGQRLVRPPKTLLAAAGFAVRDVPEGHLCCGSAGTYNLTQPAIAQRLRDRKIANIETTHPDVIATGNVGCITQLAPATRIPIVHTVELLDWATGGPVPEPLAGRVQHADEFPQFLHIDG